MFSLSIARWRRHATPLLTCIRAFSHADSQRSATELDSEIKGRGRIYEDGQHSIEPEAIPFAGWTVLWRLKKHGETHKGHSLERPRDASVLTVRPRSFPCRWDGTRSLRPDGAKGYRCRYQC